MGREVRRVPKDWQHPKEDMGRAAPSFRPLLDCSYTKAAEEFMAMANSKGLQFALDDMGRAPDKADYMPEWTEAEATHFMMYETTSKGTPISPAFATPEELARWLADTGASSFAEMTATYEQWLAVARGGWAPSAVISGGVMRSGVEAMGDKSHD